MQWVATDKGHIHKATTRSIVTCWGRCCGLQAIDVNPNMAVIDVIELVTLDHIELYGNDMIGGITIVGHWKDQGIGLEELLEALSLEQSQKRSHDRSELDIQKQWQRQKS